MASIRNSISMTDRMTPVLRSILKSVDSTLASMKQLDKASNKKTQSKAFQRAEKDIQRANNALIKMVNQTDRAGDSATKASGKYRSLGSVVGSIANGFRALGTSSSYFVQSLASGVYLAQRLANVVSGIMETSDTSRSQVARLGLYNTSGQSNEHLYDKVFRTAMDTRSDLTATSDLVNRLLLSGVYSGPGAPDTAIGTAGLINKALVAGGGTSEENNRALVQLTQGLASGMLQGDELRSIREQSPYLMKVLAEGLAQIDDQFKGIGVGDLKALGAEGELTADRIVKAFWAMQDEINSDFEAMPKTFGQAVTSLSNIWQYFLFMLSDTDGPLGRINNKLWQFVDYLQSPQGFELLNGVATGIDIISMALSAVMTAVGNFVVFLQENTSIAQALFIALGVAAAVAGISAMVSWIAATWPILLLIAIVFLLAWAFIEAGFTAQQVVGAIIGSVLWLVAAIWDAIIVIVVVVMYLGAIIIEAILGIVWIVIFVLQVIGQAILWVILSVWTAIEAIGLGIATVFMTIWGGIQAVLGWIENGVYKCFSGVLDGLQIVADAIDAVLGTSLGDTVSGWTKGLDDIHATVSGFLDAGETFNSIEDMWAAYGERTASRYSEDSEWTITDNMANTFDAFSGAMGGVWDFTVGADNFLSQGMINPNEAFDAGYNWGEGVVDGIGNFELGLPDSSVFDAYNQSEVTVNGGYLDGINSDVEVSDEDIQLLRDMAARDFLLQLQTITPVANVTFGDVRETADVGKIVEVIEQMVDEQLATSIVS